MADNERQQHSQMSIPMGKGAFYSHNPDWKPNGSKTYKRVGIQYWAQNIYLHFANRISDENVVELSCMLTPVKIGELAHMLEGVMARRRDAFVNDQPYDPNDNFRIPITKRNSDGSELVTGDISISTELVDDIPRIKMSYYNNERDKKIDVVFCSETTMNVASGSIPNNKIDMKDISVYSFLEQIKLATKAETGFLYNALSTLFGSILKVVNPRSNNKQPSNNKYGNSDYNRGDSSYSNHDNDDGVF